MVKELLTGVLAVTAFISLGGHVLRGKPLVTLREKMLFGLGAGSLGAALLFLGVPV